MQASPMDWWAIIEGTVSGVVASVVFAGMVLLRNRYRNEILERSIRRGLKRSGVGCGLSGATLTVRNDSEVDIQIRRVTAVTLETSFDLVATEGGNSSNPVILSESVEAVVEPTAKALGSYRFHLFAGFLTYYEGPLECVEIEVAFPKYGGGPRILTEQIDRDGLDSLNGLIDNLEAQFQSGSFNKARAMFGMSPIPPKQARRSDPEE